MNLSFKTRLLITFIIYAITLFLIAFFLVFFINKRNLTNDLSKRAQLIHFNKSEYFYNYIQDTELKIYSIHDSTLFQNYLSTQNRDYVNDLFFSIIKSASNIRQLRYINNSGQEVINVKRDSPYTKAYIINQKDLKNRSNSLHCNAIKTSKKNEICHSSIQLVRENSMDEIHRVPVIQVGMPVYHQDELRGILLVDIFMGNFLNILKRDPLYNIYLIDKDGHFLQHPKSKYNWTKQFDINYSIIDQFPNTYKDILNNNEFSNKLLYSRILSFNHDDKITMIIEPKSLTLEEKLENEVEQLFIIIIILIIISIPLAHFLSIAPTKLKEEVDDLNKNLDKRIKEEVDKRTQQEEMLIQQARSAAMGEMISMIAHQWRQPLNVLSIIIQNMQLSYKYNKFDKAYLDKQIDKCANVKDMMSDTLDNFTDFFKPDREETTFSVQNAITHSIKLIQESFKTYNITINTKFIKKEQFIVGIENELCQVIINMLSNCKDAFVEQEIKDPKVDVTCTVCSNCIRINIIDNGGGIKPTILSKIFDPYFTTKNIHNGTGLGLYMSKIIIQKHFKGRITVINTTDGTNFLIILPKENQKVCLPMHEHVCPQSPLS